MPSPTPFFRFGADGTYLDVRLAEGGYRLAQPGQQADRPQCAEVAPSYLAEQAMQNITLALQTGRMQTFEFERTTTMAALITWRDERWSAVRPK